MNKRIRLTLTFLILLLFIVENHLFASFMYREWTKLLGTTANDDAYHIAISSLSDIYITGKTESGLDGNTYSGNGDIFLVKYDKDGNKTWTKQLGTINGDEGQDVSVDSLGNVYITGLTCDGLDGNTGIGGMDIFLTKYSPDGTRLWTKQNGTAVNEYAKGITIDDHDNIYITGYTDGDLNGNVNIGNSDVFISKYNTSGTRLWTKQFGTTNFDDAYRLAVDRFGNIYITGYTKGDLEGNGNAGSEDIFVVKYSSEGINLWTRQIGSTNRDFGREIVTDENDNIYVTGYTFGDLDGNTNLGGCDIFLLKYDSSGNKQWTKQVGTPANDYGTGINFDSLGNIYIAGYTLGSFSGYINSGGEAIFLMKCDSLGNSTWVNQLGSPNYEYTNNIVKDSLGNIYLSGYTYGNLNQNTNAGGSDIFLIKFSTTNIWEIQTVDSTGDPRPGEMVLDTNNYPHICYYEWDNSDLKYAKWTGSSWQIETVDSLGNVGSGSSMVIDSSNNPHIAYIDNTDYKLKYAKWTGSSWQIETVASNDVTKKTSIALDSKGNPQIAFGCYYVNLKYAKWTGSSWNIQTVENGSGLNPWCSLKINKQDQACISYLSQESKTSLKYAKWNGILWDTKTVDSGGYIGDRNSLNLDYNGRPHISYYDETNRCLKYAKWTGTNWSTQTVDTDGYTGYGSSIFIDINNRPHIANYDWGYEDLKYSKWNGVAWESSIIDSQGRVGANPTMVCDTNGNIHISYSDEDNTTLKYAIGYSLVSTGVPEVDTSSPSVLAIVCDGTGLDISNTTSLTELSANWDVAIDMESDIARYWYAIGTTSGGTDVINWTDNGNITNVTRTGLTLIVGTTYYFSIKAENGVGLLSTTTNSNGQKVVLLPSAPLIVRDGTAEDINSSVSTTTLSANWDMAVDTITGIARYWYAIGTTSSGTDVVNWSSTTATNVTKTELSLTIGTTYYFSVKAENGAGLQSNITSSDGIFVLEDYTVNPLIDNFFTYKGTQIEIPAGAITTSTKIEISVPAINTLPILVYDPKLKGTSIVMDIKLADGTRNLAKDITLTIPYIANDIQGLNEANLRLFYWDTDKNNWVLISNSYVDVNNKVVIARVNHLSIFRVMSYSGATEAIEDLSNYPNPFNASISNTKIRYTLKDNAEVKIKIYDLIGGLVWDKEISAVAGPNEVNWDGKNDAGRNVGKGAYICIAECNGIKIKTKIGVK